ncbi:MAG: rhodanese-related sulfurtransferase, partial [Nannocystaceae bacterium]
CTSTSTTIHTSLRLFRTFGGRRGSLRGHDREVWRSPGSTATFPSMADIYTIAAFYEFATLSNLEAYQRSLRALCERAQLRGTILLAPEGVNGTVAGPSAGIEELLVHLRALPGCQRLSPKFSTATAPPFHRMKVRIKHEIVTIGDAEIDPTSRVGEYVTPEDWNALIDDPETLVIDTRNDYEVRVGTFKGAINPNIETFRDFPAWVQQHLDPAEHRRVAMFCTGGIRCEKATSLLLREGFESVHHLQGGILNYLQRVPETESTWSGECFVFDQRVALDHDLQPGTHSLCFGCQEPLSPQDRAHPDYEASVCCPRCASSTTPEMRAQRRERARQVALAAQRGERHVGR